MIWQRSVVAKEKVRTIEVNDYGCKKGIKNSCRKRIRHSNNLAGILPSYFGWFQHCNAVNLKRTILDEVRKIENK